MTYNVSKYNVFGGTLSLTQSITIDNKRALTSDGISLNLVINACLTQSTTNSDIITRIISGTNTQKCSTTHNTTITIRDAKIIGIG